MSKSNQSLQAEIHAAIGASGSGKTHYVMQEIKRHRPKRLVVWDTKEEFAAAGLAEPVARIQDMITTIATGKHFRLAYMPWGDDKRMQGMFDTLCSSVFYAKKLTLIAEELADTTTASRAVTGWRRCTTQGRAYGIHIYGLTQRPASVDKSFFGNCSSIRCGRLNYEADVRAMANALRVPKKLVESLMEMDWIKKDMNTAELTGERVRKDKSGRIHVTKMQF